VVLAEGHQLTAQQETIYGPAGSCSSLPTAELKIQSPFPDSHGETKGWEPAARQESVFMRSMICVSCMSRWLTDGNRRHVLFWTQQLISLGQPAAPAPDTQASCMPVSMGQKPLKTPPSASLYFLVSAVVGMRTFTG